MFTQRMRQTQLSYEKSGFDQADGAMPRTGEVSPAEPSTLISSVISAMRGSLSAISRAVPASLRRILDGTEAKHCDKCQRVHISAVSMQLWGC